MAPCDHAAEGPSDENDGSAEGLSPGLKPESEKISAFLARCGLRQSAVVRIQEFTEERFPDRRVVVAPFQGYCSYTLVLLDTGDRRDSGYDVDGTIKGDHDADTCWIETDKLVQFRPRRHSIDVRICEEARRILRPGVVPEVRGLGELGGLETADGKGELVGYVVERIGGVSLTEFGRTSRVVKDLARVFADSWRGRRDSAAVVKGRVGESLRRRLDVMSKNLPKEFRGVVKQVMREMDAIEGMPWVITHGDLVPDNIMVRPDDGGGGQQQVGELVGLIDWAEAEWLPFGVGMYGLEEVLGGDILLDEDDGGVGVGKFEYYPEAEELRAAFWDELEEAVDDVEVIKKAKWAQVLGVLLWRGIAFDDGSLDRVVDWERDWWDAWRLRTWLFGKRGLGMSERRWERLWDGVLGWVKWCFGWSSEKQWKEVGMR